MTRDEVINICNATEGWEAFHDTLLRCVVDGHRFCPITLAYYKTTGKIMANHLWWPAAFNLGIDNDVAIDIAYNADNHASRLGITATISERQIGNYFDDKPNLTMDTGTHLKERNSTGNYRDEQYPKKPEVS